MFIYCKICGLIVNAKTINTKCEVCDAQMHPVPQEYLSSSGMIFISQDKKKEFEKIIQQGEDYNEAVHEKIEEILRERRQIRKDEIAEKVDHYNKTRVKIRCPICHSETLEKISNVGKVVKVGVFGILGAGDIGKKYKCKSCGYRF